MITDSVSQGLLLPVIKNSDTQSLLLPVTTDSASAITSEYGPAKIRRLRLWTNIKAAGSLCFTDPKYIYCGGPHSCRRCPCYACGPTFTQRIMMTHLYLNPFKPEFTIVIFINYKPRIAAAILDMWMKMK